MTIESETVLMPCVVADAVIQEAAYYIHERHNTPLARKILDRLADTEPDTRVGDILADFADGVFAKHQRFRRQMNGRHCREWLYCFMRHWLAGWLARNFGRSALDLLPLGFAMGKAP